MTRAQDWTSGVGAMLIGECVACGWRAGLGQKHCARCDSQSLDAVRVEGVGRVWSITVVHRGPTKDAMRNGPYGIALIDLAEGVRVMTRADTELAIGMSVRIGFREINGTLLPYASTDRADDPEC